MRRLAYLTCVMTAAASPLLFMAAPAMAAEYRVVVRQMKFGPLPDDLQAGDVIIWDNQDYVPHSATAKDGSFDVELPANTSQSQTLDKAGTWTIICKYHPDMQTVMTVKPD